MFCCGNKKVLKPEERVPLNLNYRTELMLTQVYALRLAT